MWRLILTVVLMPSAVVLLIDWESLVLEIRKAAPSVMRGESRLCPHERKKIHQCVLDIDGKTMSITGSPENKRVQTALC